MKVFVTGASGFIGSAVVLELIAAGHSVVGLVRSDEAAAKLAATGAQPLRGELTDLDILRKAAAESDGVIHTAFIHDFSNFGRSVVVDKQAIDTFGEALAGSNRPLVVSAGIAGLAVGQVLTEDVQDATAGLGRLSESAGLALASQGVRSSAMRLSPSVHGEGDHGFVPQMVNIAREKGVAGYPGDGSNRWAAVHRTDAARLYRLALENVPAGTRLHAVADEGVSMREIAEVIGRRLNVPVVSVPLEQAPEHFGWLGRFISLDIPASSKITQEKFDWHPTELSLLEDLDHDYYFK